MSDDAAIRTIKVFLLARGFDAAKAVDGVEDGNWILARIDLLCRVCCRDSYRAGIKNTLDKLERGMYLRDEELMSGESEWTEHYSKIVRKQADLPS